MASFELEDNTDEDFFDNLVDDDIVDFKSSPLLQLQPNVNDITNGNDSDVAKPFSDLSVQTPLVHSLDLVEPPSSSSINEEDISTTIHHNLTYSNSFAFDNVTQDLLNTPANESEHASKGGVKEVQWTDFSTESAENGSNDFFTDFGDSPADDQIGNNGVTTSQHNVVDDSLHIVENVNQNSFQFQEVHAYATDGEQSNVGQDQNSSQQWENLYPGWKYDANSGQWYQVNDAAQNVQQSGQSVAGTVGEKGTTETVTSWNSVSQVNHTNESLSQQKSGYPSHMVFDPQYPGWYYDMNTQQWCSLDAYNSQSIVQAQDQVNHNGFSATNTIDGNDQGTYGVQEQLNNQSFSNVEPKGSTMWQPAQQQVNQNGFSATNTYYGNDQRTYGGQDQLNKQSFSNVEPQESTMWQPSQQQVNQNGFSATNTYYGNDQKPYGGDQGQLLKQSGFEGSSNSQGSFSNVEQKGPTMWQPAQQHVNQNGFSATNTYYGNDQKPYGGGQDQQGSTMWQPDTIAKSVPMSDFRGNQFIQNSHGTSFPVDNHVNQHQSFQRSGQVGYESPAVSGAQSFVPNGNFNQSFSQHPGEMMNVPTSYSNQTHLGYSQQQVQNGQQVSYATATAGRSSAGRPPHALVTFGFGGKLIVMKDTNALINQSFGNQNSSGGSYFVHNMAEVITGGTNASSSYFDTLSRQSFPGPLAGNGGGKELSKWIDERITHSESSNMDYRNSEVLKLLFSLLKIASQHHGILRSPFGTDTTSKENDAPEVAVARLFASVSKNTAGYSDYGHFTQCLQQLPSERETQVTAAEVQTLLVSGRKMEALQRAQDGQLWGPALVLSAQLGDQFYVDTVRRMALRQLVAGSPLRTLCLLIAGQPADAFSSATTTDGVIPGAVNMSQQVQPGANCMLDDWEENLAVITANRTKDDELVLIHLGDCLWKERSNIIAAHICYLVAEANIEPYSDTARLCLIGADHWQNPRTYASPEAIQRTEVYEYAKLQENSWSTLLPFQPYKIIYAHMLAEVGRVSDSLKYCQSVSKSIKTARASEVEAWRLMVTSLEDRIKYHQESGFSAILAPAKIVGKLRNLFGSTTHRVGGGLPPPVPSITDGHTQNEQHYQATGPRVLTSQSTMAMSSLAPSASLEPINQWSDDANSNIVNNRSVSAPDFSRSPKQVVSSKESSGGTQNKSSGGTSRFRPFGFGSQLLQKTVGLVLKPRGGDKQAKLGDTNKFYYDEKLKRWVEEGADLPAEEASLAPPPTMATFQNGPTSSSSSDYNLRSALKSEAVSQTNGISELSSPMSTSGGIPQIPPATSNQFSARGRLGVRARYVDTFNQGGGGGNPTNLFQSPPTPTIKPIANPKFFVPTPSTSTSTEQPIESLSDNTQPPTSDGEENPSSTSSVNNSSSFQSFPQLSSAMTRQKFSSMDNISKAAGTGKFANHIVPPGTRRIASWSGNEQGFSFSNGGQEQKRESFVPGEVSLMHSPMINDDLQEVDL